MAGTCWNGSPYQPVPVARDVPQKVAVKVLEQSEDYPGVLAQQESVRAYPSPYGVNGAHVLGYLSPITEGELDEAEKDDDTRSTAPRSSGGPASRRPTTRGCAASRATRRWPSTRWAACSATRARSSRRPGDTLVTSIDAEVQAYVEKQLHGAMMTARGTFDKVTGRNYEADSGAAVVMEAKTGRDRRDGQPADVRPHGLVRRHHQQGAQAALLQGAGNPLLSRASQGQFAPGSTWKPIMTVGALNNGFSEGTQLDCSSGLQVGNRWFKNYESAAYGYISFAKALELSCDTFFYRVGLKFWQKYGSDPANVKAKDPLVSMAKEFGFGTTTGGDVAGEASGRIADRKWKLAYWKAMKGYYCKVDARTRPGSATSCTSSPTSSASRASTTAPATRSTS